MKKILLTLITINTFATLDDSLLLDNTSSGRAPHISTTDYITPEIFPDELILDAASLHDYLSLPTEIMLQDGFALDSGALDKEEIITFVMSERSSIVESGTELNKDSLTQKPSSSLTSFARLQFCNESN